MFRSLYFYRTTCPKIMRTFLRYHSEEKTSSQHHTTNHPPPTTSTNTHHKSTTNMATESIKHYTQDLNKAYAEIEKKMMERIKENNQNRFRLILLSTSLAIVWITAIFGGKIRKMLTQQTADIARETLENESIKVQTNELATAVVQTILNDKEITANAAKFLREASTAPETQQALLSLTLHVLQHPDTLKEVNGLVKLLLEKLTHDEVVKKQLADLLIRSLLDPEVKKTLVDIIVELCKDSEVMQSATELVLHVIVQPPVIEATNNVLYELAQGIIADKQIVSQSRQFVADVVGDDMLQREGGNALWNSVTHAVKPGLFRIIGFSLLCSSVALFKLAISPY